MKPINPLYFVAFCTNEIKLEQLQIFYYNKRQTRILKYKKFFLEK
jgi:hypothetical protein